MRFNKYTLLIPNGKKTILYNVISKILIEFDCEVQKINEEFFSSLSKEDISFYKERLLISEDDNNDYQEMLGIKEMYNRQKDVGHFVIHLGYSCNLKCDYCYQTTIDKEEKGKKLDAKEFMQFFKKVSIEKNFEDYDICFIGGEPILYYETILRIMDDINELIPDKNIYYSAVTNGTLLNDKFRLSELIHGGLIEYQITLDGIKEDHDKHRRSSLKGSFDEIVKNIKNIKEKYPNVYITLNYNLSKDNHNKVFDFFEYLKKEKIEYPVIFSSIFDNGVNISLEIHQHDETWKKAHTVAIKYGQIYTPFYRDLYLGCAMTQENYFIIGADGKMYKCINAVGNEKHLVGNIGEYGCKKYKERVNQFMQYFPERTECKSCELFPVCFGGCCYMNEIHGFHCDKGDFYHNEIEIIKEIVNASN